MRSVFILLIFFSATFRIYCQDSIVVFFPFNSDKITQEKLNQIKTKLVKQASSVSKIIGYTDSVGNFLYNQDLSQRRAKKLHELLSKGDEVRYSNTEILGMGELNFRGTKGRKVVIHFNQKISNQIRKAKNGENIKMNNLNFEPGSELLLPESTPVLNDLLDIMNEFPKLVISIEGHICCEKNDDTNLSSSRAKVVYDFLVKNGIKAERLSYKGFGSSRPIYPLPEQNDIQQVANRRVEIRIISKS
jgi:outer membrane protein OmpA-like peptidoglycan-associated protein